MRKTLLLFCSFFLALAALAQEYPPHQEVDFKSTNLPLVIIDTQGQTISKDDYIAVQMKIVDNSDDLNYVDLENHPDQHLDYDGWIAIKYRGNTSFDSADKKPYAFQTLESEVLPQDGGSKKKVKLLGMGKDSKWAVIAPFADKVLFRDILTFDLARPYMDFTPQAKLCEFVINGVYYGVFAISERVSGGKDRLNLHDPGEDGGDLTGDYHVELDRSNEPNYTSKYNAWADLTGDNILSNVQIHYQYKDPDEEDLTDDAKNALIQEIDNMEDAFASDDYADPVTGYRKYIDVTSFIDYMLSTELGMNIDGYRLSTNYYKYSETRAQNEDLDHRWKMALWDFNLAWGNADYADGEKTDVWHYELNFRHPDHAGIPFYWCRLVQDPTFMDEVKARWAEYRQGDYSDVRIMEKVDSLVNLLTDPSDEIGTSAVDRNFEAWQIHGSYVWPNFFYGNSYEEDVDYMKNWIRKRLRFMDSHLLIRDVQTEPLKVADGWNADVIAEAAPVMDYITRGMDQDGHMFYSETLQAEGGMPADRIIVSERNGINYELQPYDENNCVALEAWQTAHVLFDTPFQTTAIHVLMTCTQGDGSEWNVTVNYTDGSTEEPQPVTIRDWVVLEEERDGTEAKWGLGAMDENGNYVGSSHNSLFETMIYTDPDKEVSTLDIECVQTEYCTFAFAFSKEVETNVVLDEFVINDSQADKTPYEFTKDQSVKKITYHREFSDNVAGKRQCWFVPFDYTLKEADLDNATFYKLHMIVASDNPEGGEVTDPDKVYLYINSVEAGTTLQANRPYIIKPKTAGVYTFVEEGDLKLKAKTSKPIASVSTTTNEYKFYGTYSTFGPTEDDKEWLTMNTDGNLMWNKGGKHDVKPYRWYIVPTVKGDYANTFIFVEDDASATDITALSNDQEMVVEGFYSVDGMRLAEPVKGLNIVKLSNGQTHKVIIR